MRSRERFTAAGVGAVACAACCAAPVLALLTATGIATVAGFMIFGTAALVAHARTAAIMLTTPTVASGVENSSPARWIVGWFSSAEGQRASSYSWLLPALGRTLTGGLDGRRPGGDDGRRR